MGVTMESSKVTSKTSSLKALLIRAWRERWSDLQWGIHIKKILPRGVSGDVYNLADCILQQALVGPAPNQLVLSYLKHSLSSQLVSYASVLQRIAKYDGFHKPHCIICLLELIENIQSGITCRGKPEEGILAGAILNLIHWLLQCYHHALSYSSETMSEMLEKPATIMNNMLACDFLIAMLYLAKHDDKELYNDVTKKCEEIKASLAQIETKGAAVPSIADSLQKLCRLELGPNSLTSKAGKDEDLSEPLTHCVQALLAVQVMQNSSSDTTQLANQLRLLQRLKGYKMSRLCCEVMRACLMSLNDVLGTSEESKWGAFTFLKLPHILSVLIGNNLVSAGDGDFSEDVVEAVQLLLHFVPLVDLMDSPASSNCIEALLVELAKLKLLNDSHVKAYTTSRDLLNTGLPRLEINSGTQTSSILKVTIRAQPTLQRILMTLDADYSKIQDALPNVLCQVLSGKSFELILSVASVEGKLKTFVSKLIKFNECAKSGGATRAVLFDITFIMLCSIVQTHGSMVMFDDDSSNEKSFFQKWVEDCMIERGKPKCPDAMLQHNDNNVVDALLAQLTSNQPDFSSIGVGWDIICMNVAAAMKEVVLAWERGALTALDVKRILDNMRQSMCCLPICASIWLCSYMQILHQDALLKPMNMVQQFLTPLTNEESQQDNFKERFSLMIQVIRKMQYDMHLTTSSKMKVITLSHSIVSKEPMSEELAEVWSEVQEKGWLNMQATHALESLFATAGASWFVSNLVKEIMKLRFKEELDRAVDLALAVFHLDIEMCTEVLLVSVLPQYLHNSNLSIDIVEPQCTALAKLCAYCTYAAWQSQTANPSRKRSFPPADDLEDLIPTKMLHLEEGPLHLKTTPSETPAVPPLQEPLLTSLKTLFSSFSLITEHSPHISQHTHFVFRVLEQLVICGRDQTKPLLQGMPSSLVPSLVRALPHMFSTDLVLRLYDLTSTVGRKSTASDLCLLRNLSLKPSV